MKKLLLFSIIILTLIGCEKRTCPLDNEIWYTTTDGEQIYLSGILASENEIVSNKYIGGMGIITLRKPLVNLNPIFQNQDRVTSVVLPNSLTNVETFAFMGCTSLRCFEGKFASEDNRSLIVNNRMVAFAPYNLEKYSVPNGVTDIAPRMFQGCKELKYVTLPNGISVIRERLFQESGLVECVIPKGVTTIESWAFDSCNDLKFVDIPGSVVSAGSYTFYRHSSELCITCYSFEPPTVDSLHNPYDDSATMFVPLEAVELYGESGWNSYKIIGVNFGDTEMVFVKGGTFTMGATSEQGSDVDDNEKPTHSVTLSDYYIGKYEVTQAQWRAVMGNNPSNFKGDNLPVENVSWDDIQVFIQKLNERTGKNFRLPTEAEWEYAARGGSQSKGYKYSGSNTLDDVAWYYDNTCVKTYPVGQKQPNELGIYDMSGNVLEWCQDWYDSYSSSSQTNPTGPSSGSRHVLRGGSWNYDAGDCRVSTRGSRNPSNCSYNYGFRLVCSPE